MNSIANQTKDVDAERPFENNKSAYQNVNQQAGADSSFSNVNGATTASLKQERLLLAKDLKELISMSELMESDGHRLKHTGNYYMCRCPFHDDNNPSFGIRAEYDDSGKCFACGWYGDIVGYEMEFHKVDFKAAWVRLNDFYYNCPREGRKAKKSAIPTFVEKVELSIAQKMEQKKYAARLSGDKWLANRICKKRKERTGEKWSYHTIHTLAEDGSLGWTGDALAFIYSTGTKIRKWPDKEIHWECGGPSLWREHMIAGASHIYLTEGETDAIALIDTNIEDATAYVTKNAVVAVPSATTFKPEWGPLFMGKTVIICFDNDEAGRRGAEVVGAIIAPYAKQVSIVDLGGAK